MKIDVRTASKGQNRKGLACQLQEQLVALEGGETGVPWLYHQVLSRKRDRGGMWGAVEAGRPMQELWLWSRWEAVRWQ